MSQSTKLEQKAMFAALLGIDPCENPTCGYVMCECGKRCGCGKPTAVPASSVSPDDTSTKIACGACADFKWIRKTDKEKAEKRKKRAERQKAKAEEAKQQQALVPLQRRPSYHPEEYEPWNSLNELPEEPSHSSTPTRCHSTPSESKSTTSSNASMKKKKKKKHHHSDEHESTSRPACCRQPSEVDL